MIGRIFAIGAVGLLGYELYRRWTATATSSGSGSVSTTTRTSIEDPPMYLGETGPMTLRKGMRYRMRFRQGSLAWSNLPGFAHATIYTSPSALPADWPKVAAYQTDTATRFAVATWETESVKMPKPDGLWQIWPTESEAT